MPTVTRGAKSIPKPKKSHKKIARPTLTMEELLQHSPELNIPDPGSLVTGTVLSCHRNTILVDLGNVATGIISGKEVRDTADTAHNIKPGDQITASVVESENEEGFIVLSLRRASQEKAWKKFLDAYESGDVIDVVANQANKGGLLLEVDNIKGFIPVSQLAPMHYPRVDGADPSQILARLQKLVGKTFRVKIINVDQENGKLILSEKAAFSKQRNEKLQDLKKGLVVKGKISGIVKFGIFVAFDGLEGLVHISEIAWGHVKNPADYGHLGQEMEAMVIGVEGDKISLSFKRLQKDPWSAIAEKYPVGTVVTGEITRLSPFGAFVKLDDELSGLIHISELSSDPELKDPNTVVKIGQTVSAKVIALEPDERRIGLSLKDVPEQKAAKKKPMQKST